MIFLKISYSVQSYLKKQVTKHRMQMIINIYDENLNND